jgi:D-beta-D-heptose 7-phosphate kinase/D-beta-D-heptose 1-phosphate adenosyltransferase
MIDRYLWGHCNRISPEAPVQVLDVDKETSVLGGAGNVVNNLKSMGAHVHVIGVVGKDSAASSLEVMLKRVDASYDLLVEVSKKTTVKTRLMASNHQIVRFDEESSEVINSKVEIHALKTFKGHIDKYDIVLISDYGKGFLTESLLQNLIKISNQKNKRVLIDPKGVNFSKYRGAYLLTPNRHEASIATNINIVDENSLLRALSKIKADCALKASLITLSENGIAVLEDELSHIPTSAKEVYDVTGAGDTVLASLGFALGAGLVLKDAIVFANYAAAVVVGKIGSSVATIDEVLELQCATSKEIDYPTILPIAEIDLLASDMRAKGKKLVFTNGCFDILHIGHVKYLQKAKAFGDILIVGINSDQSVRALKGAGRPINGEEDRALIVSALESVDFVVIFDNETPYDLIQTIQPDVLVKGGDYKGKDVVGQDLVSNTQIVDFVEGKATTTTIKRIRDNDKAGKK